MSAGSGWPSPFAFPDAGPYQHHLPSPSVGSAWHAHELALLAGLPDGGEGGRGEAVDMDVLEEEDGMGGTVILGRSAGAFVHAHDDHHPQQQQQHPGALTLAGTSDGGPHHPAAHVNGHDHGNDDDDDGDEEEDEEEEEDDDDDPDGEGDSDDSSSAAVGRRASARPDERQRGRSAAAASSSTDARKGKGKETRSQSRSASSAAGLRAPSAGGRSSPDRPRASSSTSTTTAPAAAAASSTATATTTSAGGPARASVVRRASTTGPDDDGSGGAKRKKRSRPSTGRAPGRPKDDLISQLAVVREATGRLHCIAERCTQTWSSRTPLRIKHHASVCPHLPSATRALAAAAHRHAMDKAAERKAAKEGISFVDSDEEPVGARGGRARPASSGPSARGGAGEMEVDERHRPRSAGPARTTSSSAGPSSLAAAAAAAAGFGGPSGGAGGRPHVASGQPSFPAPAHPQAAPPPPPLPARTDSAPAQFHHALQHSPVFAPPVQAHPAPTSSVHPQHLQHPHHFQQHHAVVNGAALGQRAESFLGLPTFPLPSFEPQPPPSAYAHAHALPPPSSMHSNGAAAAATAGSAGRAPSPVASVSGLSSGSSGSLGGILNHFAPVAGHARYPSLGPSFLPSANVRSALFHRSASNLTLGGPGGGGAGTSSSAGGAPSPPALKLSPPKPTKQKPLWRLLTSKAFDSAARAWMHDQVLTVDTTTGLIVSVRTLESFGLAPDSDDVAVLEGVPTMDVRGMTIVPGFIDAHVHLFLHPYTEAPWQTQVQHESIVERTVRAVGHARKTLLAGFTTVRDLGSEGALDADAHLKQALGPPLALALAPRMFVASRAIVSTGSYGPRTQKWDDPGHEEVGQVVGAEVADGPAEIRKVVRRQLGRGADWIKVYADYPSRAALTPFSPRLASAAHQTYTLDELRTVVETARAGGVKVAAHATRADTIRDCVTAGVATIEHGYDADRRAFEMMKEHNVIWVPTLAAYQGSVTLLEHRSSNAQATFNLTGSRESEHLLRLELRELRLAEDRWARMKRAFKLALEVGVKIACGGDTGVFPHGDNSLEMQRMVGLGAPVLSVLAACTATGWESVRPSAFDGPAGAAHLAKWSLFASDRAATLSANLHSQPNWFVPLGPREAGEHEQPLGRLAPGYAADLVGLVGDVEAQFGAVVQGGVKLVVKGARVVQLDGVEVAAL